MKIIILGNGSSLYASFNAFSRMIKKRLENLEGKIVVYEEIDETKDMISDFNIWFEKMGEVF